MATINNIPAPADLMMAQYSLPFCVALAHYHDARDPRSFNIKSFNDTAIRSLATRVTVSVSDEAKHGHTLASTVTVTLKDGRALTRRVADFKGTPEQPLDRGRDAREVPPSHPPLRPRGDGAAVRAAREPRSRAQARLAEGSSGQAICLAASRSSRQAAGTPGSRNMSEIATRVIAAERERDR